MASPVVDSKRLRDMRSIALKRAIEECAKSQATFDALNPTSSNEEIALAFRWLRFNEYNLKYAQATYEADPFQPLSSDPKYEPPFWPY
jgi:hypothetical protein